MCTSNSTYPRSKPTKNFFEVAIEVTGGSALRKKMNRMNEIECISKLGLVKLMRHCRFNLILLMT